jgi:hypothetical protein
MSSSDRFRFPQLSRRQLLGGATGLLGSAALASFGRRSAQAAEMQFTPKAKRVVYLFMSGAPGQLETFDYKPNLTTLPAGSQLPDSIRGGQALTGMTAGQSSFPIIAPSIGFQQYGQNGTWVSDYLPSIGGIVDKISIVRTMNTDAINHDPATTLMQTGGILAGRPAFGSWVSYALGDPTLQLPNFIVLLSSSRVPLGQPLTSRYWGNGFLPSVHQGTQFQGGVDPVLYLDDGAGLSVGRRDRLRGLRDSLDGLHRQRTSDPAIDDHIRTFALAGRMQTSVPGAVGMTGTEGESASTYTLYGDEARVPGTFAWNCVMARRMLERDVPFVQLYHRDWDHHSNLPASHAVTARDVDRASAALVLDLERRGLLDDTIVLWGGEFGRTVFSQGVPANGQYGRDHHPRCFSMWMAGGGLKRGLVYGTTDDYSYNVQDSPVHVHDLHATLLQLLGFDHTRLTYRSQGRDFRLTDVAGTVVPSLLA